MAYTITYREDGGVLVKFTGRNSYAETMEADRRIAADQDHPITDVPYILYDLTGAKSFDYPADAIKDISAADSDTFSHNPDLTMVVVADTDLAYGVVRVWQAWLGEKEDQTKLFRSMTEAEAWINVNIRTR